MTFNAGYYEKSEIENVGFKAIGKNVFISRLANIVNPHNISIGSNVRIDAFTTITAGPEIVEIGNYVHIATGVVLIGGYGIKIGNYVTLSHHVCVFSKSDDYSGKGMTNPMVSRQVRCVKEEEVTLGNNVVVGASSVILPGVNILEGVSVGALSLVNKSISGIGVYAGVPAKFVASKSLEFLKLSNEIKE